MARFQSAPRGVGIAFVQGDHAEAGGDVGGVGRILRQGREERLRAIELARGQKNLREQQPRGDSGETSETSTGTDSATTSGS